MNCYVCSLEGVTSASVAICKHCGVALCLNHLRDVGTASAGGMQYDCPHNPAGVKVK